MAGGGEGTEKSLENTPTWIVAAVCSVIVFISFTIERILHYLGKFLKSKNRKPLFEALQKVKEELMLLGFISLLLAVFQGTIAEICIPIHLSYHMLPCKKEEIARTGHYQTASFSSVFGGTRRLLAGGSGTDKCAEKGKVSLLSQTSLHDIHIFIFVLALVHVCFSLFTMILGGAKIHEWKRWEDSAGKDKYNRDKDTGPSSKFTHVHDHAFIRNHFRGIGKRSAILGWLHSFFKQFYGSVTKSDYITLRLGFIMTHCKGNPKFNFHKYMVRALEADFKRVVGISWYLWFFVVIFLVLNVHGWHAYFWISFLPLILLLIVGTKLEHVISQLARQVAEKHTEIEGDLVVQPSDDHFWFHRPQLIIHLIHFILFQNAFEIAIFFWVLTTFGFDSCIMGEVHYIIPRLVIGVVVQLVCSYSTLPLYAIIAQMGSSFKLAVFEEVQEGLLGWAQMAKKRKGMKVTSNQNDNRQAGGPSAGIQLQNVVQKESEIEEQASLENYPSTTSHIP